MAGAVAFAMGVVEAAEAVCVCIYAMPQCVDAQDLIAERGLLGPTAAIDLRMLAPEHAPGAAVVDEEGEGFAEEDLDTTRCHYPQHNVCPICEQLKPECGIGQHRRKCVHMSYNKGKDALTDAHEFASITPYRSDGEKGWVLASGLHVAKMRKPFERVAEASSLEHAAQATSIDQVFYKAWPFSPSVTTWRQSADTLKNFCDNLQEHSNLVPALASYCPDLRSFINRRLASFDRFLLMDGAAPTVVIATGGRGDRGCGPARVAHNPPPGVARVLKVPSCVEACESCQHVGCQHCPNCCLYIKKPVRGFSLVACTQRACKAKERAYICVGSKAWAMSGGVALLFDAENIPSGIWVPEGSAVPNFYAVYLEMSEDSLEFAFWRADSATRKRAREGDHVA